MSAASIIFFLVFLIPLTGLLIWVMRQDKRKGKIGLYVLGLIVVAVVWFMYFMTKGK
jgi:4-amino-4-deoxy-L-arabinose transferase-like glycosyltransferase